eukprot:gene5637-15730_t
MKDSVDISSNESEENIEILPIPVDMPDPMSLQLPGFRDPAEDDEYPLDEQPAQVDEQPPQDVNLSHPEDPLVHNQSPAPPAQGNSAHCATSPLSQDVWTVVIGFLPASNAVELIKVDKHACN